MLAQSKALKVSRLFKECNERDLKAYVISVQDSIIGNKKQGYELEILNWDSLRGLYTGSKSLLSEYAENAKEAILLIIKAELCLRSKGNLIKRLTYNTWIRPELRQFNIKTVEAIASRWRAEATDHSLAEFIFPKRVLLNKTQGQNVFDSIYDSNLRSEMQLFMNRIHTLQSHNAIFHSVEAFRIKLVESKYSDYEIRSLFIYMVWITDNSLMSDGSIEPRIELTQSSRPQLRIQSYRANNSDIKL